MPTRKAPKPVRKLLAAQIPAHLPAHQAPARLRRRQKLLCRRTPRNHIRPRLAHEVLERVRQQHGHRNAQQQAQQGLVGRVDSPLCRGGRGREQQGDGDTGDCGDEAREDDEQGSGDLCVGLVGVGDAGVGEGEGAGGGSGPEGH